MSSTEPSTVSLSRLTSDKVLVPELRQGDVVIMDNLPGHKGSKVRQLIEAVGASLLYLPPYSPDFNPIENAFAKLKALLRKAAQAGPVEGLWSAIGQLIDLITPQEIQNLFAAAGYDAALIGFCSSFRMAVTYCNSVIYFNIITDKPSRLLKKRPDELLVFVVPA